MESRVKKVSKSNGVWMCEGIGTEAGEVSVARALAVRAMAHFGQDPSDWKKRDKLIDALAPLIEPIIDKAVASQVVLPGVAKPRRLYEYRARLRRVVDGDTFDAEVDLGFHVWVRERFRLIGVDTPERGQPGFSEATILLERLIRRQEDKDGLITIESAKTGKYGRWLAELPAEINRYMQKFTDLQAWLPLEAYLVTTVGISPAAASAVDAAVAAMDDGESITQEIISNAVWKFDYRLQIRKKIFDFVIAWQLFRRATSRGEE